MNEKIWLEKIEARLDELTSSQGQMHPLIAQAMRYSLLDAGKRVRPMLTLCFCEAAGGDAQSALDCACAVEMVHTYSLIHDDLPCMDNDDMRRGKPSCHKAYGEAEALLAGDALLTLAFETVMSADKISAQQRVCAGRELARLSGALGMIGGQVIDLQSEGEKVGIDTLQRMDEGKTCALIEAACVIGCICAGANEHMISLAREYAHGIGMAFQIVDDILDIVGDEKKLGKPVASDAQNDKSTYVSILGIDTARRTARQYTEQAVGSLSEMGGTDQLREFAEKLLNRIN